MVLTRNFLNFSATAGLDAWFLQQISKLLASSRSKFKFSIKTSNTFEQVKLHFKLLTKEKQTLLPQVITFLSFKLWKKIALSSPTLKKAKYGGTSPSLKGLTKPCTKCDLSFGRCQNKVSITVYGD